MTKRTTQRGFASPEVRRAKPSTNPVPVSGISPLEVEAYEEEGGPSLLSGPWRAFEIWTQNHVYALDGALVCQLVEDRAGSPVPDHPVIGSRLVGGQVREHSGRIKQVSHPFPAPGASAVFTSGKKRLRVSETTPVTRVVIRQRLVDVQNERELRWDDITGA